MSSSPDSVRLHTLAPHHLPGLLAVQLACYGAGFIETSDVFARRIASPLGCSRVLMRDGLVLAYLAAYRSRLGKVTPLHGDFETVETPDTLYLHDMAVHPEQAGLGLARRLVDAVLAVARAERLPHAALVAVQGAQGYWARHGFVAARLPEAGQRARLAAYGDDAVYMTCRLAPH
ncbi:MAG: GNAT family N-acetyltransferase [Burkholderiales bacterium]|nr:GNAT family N-acetyltransferase [Burkholderiales bacterium]